jgi:YHS domain-containing protein
MPAIVTTDSVCGMEVDEASSFRAEHQKITYVFSSPSCQQRFEADPESVLWKGTAKATLENEGDSNVQKREIRRGESWRDYIPLIVITALTPDGGLRQASSLWKSMGLKTLDACPHGLFLDRLFDV